MNTDSPTRERPIWTILLYLAGDNELAEQMVKEIRDLGKLWLPNALSLLDNIKILAQFDPSGIGVPTQRYDITAGLRRLYQRRAEGRPEESGSVIDDLGIGLERLGETNTGAPETLTRFIKWGVSRNPARHYMLILSGHGSGIVLNKLASDRQYGEMSGPGDGLTLPELVRSLDDSIKSAQGLRENGGFDIIGMDACLMSMGELMFALQPYGRYFVGAEGFEPTSGWPYRDLLERLLPLIGKRDDPETVAQNIVRGYIDYYRPLTEQTEWSVDLAAVRLRPGLAVEKLVDGQATGTVEAVAEALQVFAEALTPWLEKSSSSIGKTIRNALVLAHWKAQSFQSEEYTDLWDFCGQLEQELKDQLPDGETLRALSEACRRVKSAIDNCVVASEYSGPEYQHSHGVSIYFPWWGVAEDYIRAAACNGDRKPSWSAWAKFLRHYVEATRREPRSGPESPPPGDDPRISRAQQQLDTLKRVLNELKERLGAWEECECDLDKLPEAEAKLKVFFHEHEDCLSGTELGIRGKTLVEHFKAQGPRNGRPLTGLEIQFVGSLRRKVEQEIRRLGLDTESTPVRPCSTGIFIPDHDGNGTSAKYGRFSGVAGTRFSGVAGTRFSGVAGTRFGQTILRSTMKNPPLEWPRRPQPAMSTATEMSMEFGEEEAALVGPDDPSAG